MNSEPRRIQLRRAKGWRKPQDAVVVSRPSKWGNPFRAVQETDGVELAVRLFAETARGIWNPNLIPATWSDTRVHCVYEVHARWLARLGGHPIALANYELGGWDLACWCPVESEWCHADVLLQTANPEFADRRMFGVVS